MPNLAVLIPVILFIVLTMAPENVVFATESKDQPPAEVSGPSKKQDPGETAPSQSQDAPSAIGLLEQQRNLESKIQSLNLKSLPRERHEKIEHDIEQMIDTREEMTLRLDRIESDSSLLAAQKRYKKMFLQTLKALQSSDRIKFFSSNFYEVTGLNKYLCSDQYRCSLRQDSGCKKLKALYLPLIDQIFLDPDLSENEMIVSLFHEVQHAFQYRYRFPNDISVLLHFASEKGGHVVKSEDILSYLSLIYETQALWYEIQGSQPKRWMDVTFKPGELGYFLSSAVHIGVQTIWKFLRPFVPGTTGQQPGAQQFNDLLPISDKLQINANNRRLPGLYPTELPNALFFREVVLFGNPELINLFGNLDIAFHKRMTQAVECNYYGKLNFLFETMSGNQSVVATAHDLFYSKFFGDSFDEFNPAATNFCISQIEKDFSQRGLSPLVYWLTVDPAEHLPACAQPFQVWTKSRQDAAGTIYRLQADSPFNIMAKGVEGGTGGLDVAPSLFFNPQIDFGPLPATQNQTPSK